jgi:hypothetical protein
VIATCTTGSCAAPRRALRRRRAWLGIAALDGGAAGELAHARAAQASLRAATLLAAGARSRRQERELQNAQPPACEAGQRACMHTSTLSDNGQPAAGSDGRGALHRRP